MYFKTRTRTEIIQDIFIEGMFESIKHLKKNKLLHLKDKILIDGDEPAKSQETVNPFDIKEDTSYDNVITLETMDELADFMRSKDKIQWLIDKGFKDVAIQLSNKPS